MSYEWPSREVDSCRSAIVNVVMLSNVCQRVMGGAGLCQGVGHQSGISRPARASNSWPYWSATLRDLDIFNDGWGSQRSGT
jgi:hypothetical protein